jgi:DivIVA domain-containing protein
MDQELTPGDIAARRFRQAFRGFDPDEVIEFLNEIATRYGELAAQRDRLAGRLGEFADRDLQSEFASVGEQVAGVLEAARVAADGLRERAATDAARWRSEALAEAEEERRRARLDAEHLRGDAWTTAEELLRQAEAEARRMREAAERDSLSILGEGEREAHRLTATARREAEDLLRAARMEAERLNAEATARHDEMIEQARRQADTSQERTKALEQRRQELLVELEALRNTMARIEGELDERRSHMGLSAAPEEEGVEIARVVNPEAMKRPDQDWAPGETVRVISGRREPTPPKVTDPEVVVEEVKRLRETRQEPSPPPAPEAGASPMEKAAEGEPPAPEPPPPPEPAPLQPPPEPPPPAPERTPSPATPPPPPEPAAGDDLSDLFRRLRGQPPPVPAETSPPPKTAAEEEAPPPRPRAGGPDPFDLKDRLLLPVANRALRNIKRQLTELQNQALEQLRVTGASWRPAPRLYEDQLRPDVVVLAAESFSMGHTAAEELTGKSLPRPPTPARDDAQRLVAGLAEQVTEILEQGSGDNNRETSTAVSRVFRAWRTDEAERRVSELASSAYHRGLAATLQAGGFGAAYTLSGKGCARCREAAESADPPLPPLHPGCGCSLAPAAG